MFEERLEYLDSTRGIAALIVLIFHTNNYIYHHILEYSEKLFILKNKIQFLLSIFFNGNNAVSYFFVLSGFVLSYTYLKKLTPLLLSAFIVKRIFRIFPVYLLIVIIAFLLNYSNSTYSYFSLFKELLILPDVHTLLLPGWSMTVELAFSLIVPFLICLINHKVKWYLALIFIVIILSKYINHFMVHFMLGIFVSYIFSNYKPLLGKYNRFLWLLFFTFIYFFPPIIPVFPKLCSNIEYFLSFLGISISSLFVWTPAFASAYFIYFIITCDFCKKRLSNKFLVFIGKISYSIYLVHWLVIYHLLIKFKFLYNQMSILNIYLTLNIITVITTIIFSSILYYFVELPFIQKGKKIANWVSRYNIKKILST